MVTFSWGLPGPLVTLAHSHGARVGVQVGTAQGALAALDNGCDFLICQGVEAGGHVQSSIALSDLLPAVVAAANEVPVVACGGLSDAEDIAHMFAMGASAVMLGTRFVASIESRAHPEYKRALLMAGPNSTALTGCFDGGWPYALHRVLRNKTLVDWEAAGCAPSGRRPGEADILATTPGGRVVHRYEDTPPSSEMEGDALSCCLYAGAGVAKISEILPADRIVRDLWRDACQLERHLPTGANS
jgi:nitronate monooxygenase